MNCLFSFSIAKLIPKCLWAVLFFAVFFVIELYLTWLFLMPYLIYIDQLCQHLPCIMYAPFDCPERHTPGSCYLNHGIAFGEVHEGGHRNRMGLQVSNYSEDFIHSRHLVCFLTARFIPQPQSLGVGSGESLFCVPPQVAHDCPAPCEQRTAVIVSVSCLQCPAHRLGCKVVGSLIVVAVRLGNLDQLEVHCHDALVKGHGSDAASLGLTAAWR